MKRLARSQNHSGRRTRHYVVRYVLEKFLEGHEERHLTLKLKGVKRRVNTERHITGNWPEQAGKAGATAIGIAGGIRR
jgi:hypothetical protein